MIKIKINKLKTIKRPKTKKKHKKVIKPNRVYDSGCRGEGRSNLLSSQYFFKKLSS